MVVVPHPDSPGPVVPPLHHRPRLQVIAPQLINVSILPLVDLGPEAERQQVLTVPIPQQRRDLMPNVQVLLVVLEPGQRLVNALVAVVEPPQVYVLVLVAHKDPEVA